MRPDLHVWRVGGHVALADARCTYDADVLERFYKEKIKKYTDVARAVPWSRDGLRVSVSSCKVTDAVLSTAKRFFPGSGVAHS